MNFKANYVVHDRLSWPKRAAEFLRLRREMFGDAPLVWGQAAEIFERVKSLGLEYSYTHFMKLLPIAETYAKWQKEDPSAPKTPMDQMGKRVSVSAMLTLNVYFDVLSDQEKKVIANKIDSGRFNLSDARWIRSTHEKSASRNEDLNALRIASSIDSHDSYDEAQDYSKPIETAKPLHLSLNKIATHFEQAVVDAVELPEPMVLADLGIEITGFCRLTDRYLSRRPEHHTFESDLQYCAISNSLADIGIPRTRIKEISQLGSIAAKAFVFYTGPMDKYIEKLPNFLSSFDFAPTENTKPSSDNEQLNCVVFGNFECDNKLTTMLMQQYYIQLLGRNWPH